MSGEPLNQTLFKAGGAAIGGLLGKGITNKDNGAAAGAVMGGIIAADKKNSKQVVTGYRTERQCQQVSVYQTSTVEVYSHSTIRFYIDGIRYVVDFQK